MAQRGALTHNPFKIHFAAHFIFEIELLLRETIFQFRDLTVGHRIFNSNSHLTRNLRKEIDVVLREEVLFKSGERQDTESMGTADQRHKAASLEALSLTNFRSFRIKGMQVLEVAHNWFACAEGYSRRCTFDGK